MIINKIHCNKQRRKLKGEKYTIFTTSTGLFYWLHLEIVYQKFKNKI